MVLLPCQDLDTDRLFGNRNDLSNEIERGRIMAVYVYNGLGYKIAHMHFSAYLASLDP
jgi:hypothetical protein